MLSHLVRPLALACLFSPALALSDGVCSDDDRRDGLCFVSANGFVVEALTGDRGEFPVIDTDGNSLFAYRITGPGPIGSACHDVSHADLLLPACADGGLVVLDSVPSGGVPSNGDPSCGFGVDDPDSHVFKWDHEVACDGSATFSVLLEGRVDAALTSFLLKAATNCDVDMILGPACPGNPFVYCDSGPNSSGETGRIDWGGSLSISDNNFFLTATGLPPGHPGYFFFGTTRVQVPFGNGFRCIGGDVTRYRKIDIAVTGGTSQQFDFTLPPLDQIVPGVQYYFQLYYRDAAAGAAGFNTTDALCVAFLP